MYMLEEGQRKGRIWMGTCLDLKGDVGTFLSTMKPEVLILLYVWRAWCSFFNFSSRRAKLVSVSLSSPLLNEPKNAEWKKFQEQRDRGKRRKERRRKEWVYRDRPICWLKYLESLKCLNWTIGQKHILWFRLVWTGQMASMLKEK